MNSKNTYKYMYKFLKYCQEFPYYEVEIERLCSIQRTT